LHWPFADTLAQFEAQDTTMLKQNAASYAALPQGARAAARDCKDRVQAILADTRREGFSTTARAWSMIGAISNLSRQMLAAHMTPRHARRQHEKIVKTMIATLNKAQRMGEAAHQPGERRRATVH
jgi:methylphosphotriester-DNA--protein-cysteine methyltransferase